MYYCQQMWAIGSHIVAYRHVTPGPPQSKRISSSKRIAILRSAGHLFSCPDTRTSTMVLTADSLRAEASRTYPAADLCRAPQSCAHRSEISRTSCWPTCRRRRPMSSCWPAISTKSLTSRRLHRSEIGHTTAGQPGGAAGQDRAAAP